MALCLDVDFQGAAKLKGPSKIEVAGATCKEWAEGNTKANGKPVMRLLGVTNEPIPIDGTTFDLQGIVQKYAGPGTYSAIASEGQAMTIHIAKQTWQAREEAATHSVTIAADGSGTFEFTGYTSMGSLDNPDAPAGTVSGKVSWVCADAKN